MTLENFAGLAAFFLLIHLWGKWVERSDAKLKHWAEENLGRSDAAWAQRRLTKRECRALDEAASRWKAE
jgi:hypothetical protein